MAGKQCSGIINLLFDGFVIVPALVVLAVEDWTEPCTCVVQHGGHVGLIQELNLRIRTISWCQK